MNDLDYEALKKNFDDLNASIASAKKEMSEKSKGFIEAGAKNLFDKYPFLHCVHWTQYTPYFNDGEACEFHVHEVCYTFEGDDVDNYDSSALYTQEDLDSAKKDYKNIEKFLADPVAWRQAYLEDYRKQYGRDPWNGVNNITPYPSTLERAQDSIDRITHFLNKYDATTMNNFKNDFDSFAKSINMIDEDVMQMLFGDHVSIIITRDGMEIDDHDHD